MRLQARSEIYQVDNKELSIARMCDRALMAAESVKGNYNLECTICFNDTMHEKMMLEQKIINTMVESQTVETSRSSCSPRWKLFPGQAD